MDRDAWLELNRRSMEVTLSSFARSEPRRALRLPGAFALVNPLTPERSVFNSVLYDSGDALRDAYEEIAATYAENDSAWTVWVPEDDAETAAFLSSRGHKLDATPRAMGMELDALPEPAPPADGAQGPEISLQGDVETMARLNDAAYGYAEGTYLRGIGPEPPLRVYLGSIEGEPVASVATLDHDGDCSIWCVATLEKARRRGLASALMRRALWDARQRGCETTTLQATAAGAPVYARIGYGDFGALQMWEYRP